MLDLFQHGDAIDDRKGLVSQSPRTQLNTRTNDESHLQFTLGLSILCQLPQDSDISKKLNNSIVSLLYSTLSHPPASYLGSDVPFRASTNGPVWSEDKSSVNGSAHDTTNTIPLPRMPANFRSADGSGYNPLMPSLGQAGTPYARSVQSKHPLPANMLPDPGVVFDTLLKARDVSSLFSASLILYQRLMFYIVASTSWRQLIPHFRVRVVGHASAFQVGSEGQDQE